MENKELILKLLKRALKDYRFYKKLRFLGFFYLNYNNIAFGYCNYFEKFFKNRSNINIILEELDKDNFTSSYTEDFWYVPSYKSVEGFNLRIENLEYTIKRLERGYLNL